MTRRFEGRLVLVTGGAAGLGRAIALRFAQEGARLALADIDEAGMKEAAGLIEALGTTCSMHRVDLSSEADIQAFATDFCIANDRLDVLINNAGLAYGEISTGFHLLSQEKWLRYFAINTVAPLLLAQALRAPLANAKGAIVHQSSMASNVPATAYGVTKAALNSMTYGMAHAFGGGGVGRARSGMPAGVHVRFLAGGHRWFGASVAYRHTRKIRDRHAQPQPLVPRAGACRPMVALSNRHAMDGGRARAGARADLRSQRHVGGQFGAGSEHARQLTLGAGSGLARLPL